MTFLIDGTIAVCDHVNSLKGTAIFIILRAQNRVINLIFLSWLVSFEVKFTLEKDGSDMDVNKMNKLR